MDKETREQIALIRYKIISPVLAEPTRLQNEYFRSQSQKDHLFPHYGLRKVSVSTMKSWLKTFKNEGFNGLYPKKRCDTGRPRKATPDMLNVIKARCKAYPHMTVQKLYENLLADHQLGVPPIHYNTLLRIIKNENLLTKTRQDVRKRYETGNVNDLWVCDFMHGPKVLINRRSHKAILCAIIDDHSRMITGHAFAPSETVTSLTRVLKDAFLAFGLPKRIYVDNGSAFSSEFLVKCCALAGISLTHSKPYDSPSRGKIERFFRTVRDQFLSEIIETVTLQDLNASFTNWLNEYHHRVHTGIKERPLDRYNKSMNRVEIKRLSRSELDEIFLLRHERIVNNDATISFKGSIYEVPAAYIRQRIEIRHPVDDTGELFLYDNDARVGRLKLVDTRENARLFKPNPSESVLSFADGRVEK
jgi:transposase InsO family protein